MAERDIYEVANQLNGYVGPETPKPLAQFLLREGRAAAQLAEIIKQQAARIAELDKAAARLEDLVLGKASRIDRLERELAAARRRTADLERTIAERLDPDLALTKDTPE